MLQTHTQSLATSSGSTSCDRLPTVHIPPNHYQISVFVQLNNGAYSSFLSLTEHTATITTEHIIPPMGQAPANNAPHCDEAEVHNFDVCGLGNTTAMNLNVESLAPMELCNFS